MKWLLFLIPTLLTGGPLWIPKGNAPEGLLRSRVIATGSMRPAITQDTYFWYEPYNDSVPLSVGDWVWFIRESDGKSSLHAVTALNQRAIYTTGIANRNSDGWSPRKNIIGVVRFVERLDVSYLSQVR